MSTSYCRRYVASIFILFALVCLCPRQVYLTSPVLMGILLRRPWRHKNHVKPWQDATRLSRAHGTALWILDAILKSNSRVEKAKFANSPNVFCSSMLTKVK